MEYISQGADPNAQDNEDGWTYLHELARAFDNRKAAIGLAKELLAKGANPKIQPYPSYQSPLHKAVLSQTFCDNSEMIELLIRPLLKL